ncbi:MAG: hypothetical protein UX62_C0003G0002 [Microgenomates group bacterium GW2011_GWA2_46_7]|nr:MAG: hypothetical protein UX62_C0003G0002 [Microgenomates group bacterium GW2011_GWA2_46_7]
MKVKKVIQTHTSDTPANRLRYYVIDTLLLFTRLIVVAGNWLNYHLLAGLLDHPTTQLMNWYNLALTQHRVCQISNGMYTGLTVKSLVDDPLYSVITLELDPILRHDSRCKHYVCRVVAHGSYVHPDRIHYSQLSPTTVKVVINRN